MTTESFIPAPGTPRAPTVDPLAVRCAAYKTFIHHLERVGTPTVSASSLRSDPVMLMMFRTTNTARRCLMEMAAVGMMERLRGGKFKILSDKPRLVCCICGKPLSGDCVQDAQMLLAHQECAQFQAEEHADPVTDRRA